MTPACPYSSSAASVSRKCANNLITLALLFSGFVASPLPRAPAEVVVKMMHAPSLPALMSKMYAVWS